MRKLLSLALLALFAQAASAQSRPFSVTSVVSQVFPSDGDWYTRPGQLRFYVRNVSSQTQTLVSSGDCGAFTPMDDDGPIAACAHVPTPTSVTLAAGAGVEVTIYLRLPWDAYQPDENVTVFVWPSGNQSLTTQATAVVTWSSLNSTLTARLFESSFTPRVSPHAQSLTTATWSSGALYGNVQNVGNATATFTLSVACTSGVATCSVSPTTMTVPPDGNVVPYMVNYTTIDASGSYVIVTARAPARQSGIVDRDSALFTVTVADTSAPTLSLSPSGDFDSDAQSFRPVAITTHTSLVTANACDADGHLGSVTMTVGGVAVPPATVNQLSQSGCHDAARATFWPTFVPGHNAVVVRVSDGVHTTSVSQDFVYDDSYDHLPQVVAARTNPQVGVLQTVVDTFFVTNPGWHSAQYTLTGSCGYTVTNSTCPAVSVSPASVTVAAGARVPVAATYRTSGVMGASTVVQLSASLGTAARIAQLTAVNAPVMPPTIAISPSDGATVATPTFDLVVTVCDVDDAGFLQSLTWQGQAPPSATETSNLNGCQTLTWRHLAISPWQQVATATAVDAAGHVVTRSATITYSAPLSGFAPALSPKGGTHRVRAGVAVLDTFTVKNNGTYSAAYQFLPSCGLQAGCTVTPASTSLSPGASTTVAVGYQSFSTPDSPDSVRLIAKYTSPLGSTIADTAKRAVVVPSVEAIPTVSAYSTGVTALIPSYYTTTSYRVTNRSSVQVTFDLRWAVRGMYSFPEWGPPDSLVTVAPGQSRDVIVSLRAAPVEGMAGSITMTASYVTASGQALGASATTYWTTRALQLALTVTPTVPTVFAIPGAVSHEAGFRVASASTYSVMSSQTVHCSGTATNCQSTPAGLSLQPGETKGVLVTYDIVPGVRSGKITLVARDPDHVGVVDSNTVDVSVNGSFIALEVTPKAASRTVNPNRTFAQRYYIKNLGNVAGWANLVSSCESPLVCTTPQPNAVFLNPNQRDSTTMSITTADAGTTRVARLIAMATDSSGAVVDTGSVAVATTVIADIAVSVRNAGGAANVTRDQCLTLAAGEGGAYECGDLRLAHGMPATSTLGRAHAPALTFVSRHLSGVVLFPADVSIAPGNGVTSINAHVTIDGHAPVDMSFPWDDAWSTGAPRRIVVPVNVIGLGMISGAYHYTLSVDARSGTSTIQRQDTGTVAVVNRAQSSFGAGWWVDGLEQVISVDATHKLWIGGDGNTRLYTLARDSVWIVQPTLDRPDTLIVRAQAMARHLRNGAYVEFDNLGRHTATVNSRGQRTVFGYDELNAALLKSIDLPLPSGSSAGQTSRRYSFVYGLSLDGRSYLTQINAPPAPQGARTVVIGHIAATPLVSSFSGPDATSVQFDYANGDRVSGRTDRRGFRTSYQYDAKSLTLTESLVDLSGTGDNIHSSFCAAEAAGVAACSALPADLAAIATTVDGPRSDVQDVLRVEVTRFGAPSRITDALGHVTSIERNDPAWPLLPTAVVRPNGFTTRATYTERALVATQIDEQPFAPTSVENAVTKFGWSSTSAFDQLDSVVAPTGEISRFGYLPNGDRRWQEDGRGSLSRAWFTYNGDRQLATVQSPGNSSSQVDAYVYDPVLGNLARTTTPVGITTTYHTDALGRVDTVFSPISAGLVRKQAVTFDLMDRAVEQRDIGPAVPYVIGDVSGAAPAVTLVMSTMYDREGNVDSTRRTSLPDLTAQGTLTLRWSYDGANRRVTSTDAYGKVDSVRYDAAGNATRTVSRRQLAVTSTYDALNRLTTRTTPAVTYASERMGFASLDLAWKARFPYFAPGFAYDAQANPDAMPPSLLIPGDVATFEYDVSGNMTRADNHDAQVHRGYFRNGALRSDTLRVAVVDPAEVPLSDPFSLHTYVLNYSYDQSGRRVLRTDVVPGCMDCNQVYTYNTPDGALDATFDRGATFGFAYDSAGRVKMKTAQAEGIAPIVESMAYDAASRLTSRIVAGGLYHDVLTYDDAGRVLTTSIASSLPGIGDFTQQAYNGLGALAAMRRERGGVAPLDEYTADAFGNTIQRKQWLSNEGVTSTQAYAGDRLVATNQVPLNWTPNAGRPTMEQLDSATSDFDVSGNIVRTRSHRATYDANYGAFVPRVTGNEWTWNAYSADEKLRVSQRTSAATDAVLRTVFLEHRYDALGRRVLTRTRWDQYCAPSPSSGSCLSSIDHTAWDGDQVLMEYRNVAVARVYESHPNCLPDSDINSEACRDHFSPRWSQDGLGMALESEWSSESFAGAVRYTHAGGIDEPLAIWKSGFAVGIVPHRSWRGLYEAGSYLGQSSVNISWPGRDRDAFHAPDARFTATAAAPNYWIGSIVEGKADPSGLMYMRNRYYDPKSGRFTQEDPIGLGGGVNLYGFGGGDAVNNTDPSGLCPFVNEDSCFQALANWGARSGRTWAVNLGSALQAGGEIISAIQGQGCGELSCGMGVPAGPSGEFSISNWEGYPGAVRPTGTFRIVEGAEYSEARAAANNANRSMHRADPRLAGKQIHEVKPVKLGGSPTDPANKTMLSPEEHMPITVWWNRLINSISK